MKNPFKKEESAVDLEIGRVVAHLSGLEPDDPKYASVTKQLEVLRKVRAQKVADPVTNDTLLIVAGNLIGIVLILGWENAHPVVSKALSFVLKGRV